MFGGGKMNSRPKFQRRNYFIDKDFQSRYIFKYFVLSLILIGSAFFIGIFNFFSSNAPSKEKIKRSIMDNQDFFPFITEILDKQKNIQTMINDCSFFKGKL